ncbi:MAG TPA: class I SAM-dependent methyltransferase [Vicinamibacterales bacterium]|nr:class I SAM-dependent methyltransferase [Vicinamibacterales bacterium]
MSISDLLKFGGKRSETPRLASLGDASAPKGPEQTIQSKALPKFISALSNHPGPLLIDFGPVIGTNVAFFGEQLGCKLFIEDLAAEIDKHTRGKTRDTLPDALAKRFTQADDSVDGVLCWDIFDFLEPAAAKALARQIVRVLRPGGAVMGFFCSTSKPMERVPFSKYEIVAANSSLRQRHHPGTGGPKFVMQNRDILRMFEGLAVAESFLLKSNTREILLRKRA